MNGRLAFAGRGCFRSTEDARYAFDGRGRFRSAMNGRLALVGRGCFRSTEDARYAFDGRAHSRQPVLSRRKHEDSVEDRSFRKESDIFVGINSDADRRRSVCSEVAGEK